MAIAFHERLIAEHGGAGGIRDEAMLESALARPRNLIAYGKPSLFDLAACYAFGLVKNHPFLDGNKRIGFAVAVLFLELNGGRFTASEVDVVLRTLALAAGEMSETSRWRAYRRQPNPPVPLVANENSLSGLRRAFRKSAGGGHGKEVALISGLKKAFLRFRKYSALPSAVVRSPKSPRSWRACAVGARGSFLRPCRG